jgi:hypothetical protein
LFSSLSHFRLRRGHAPWGRPRIALLGMFRAGTNYTRALLEAQYEVEVAYNLLGWKHGLLPSFAPGSGAALPARPPLVIVKHPLAALVSLHDYSTQVGRNLRSGAASWQAFLRTRLVYACDQLKHPPQYRFSNPVQMWNAVVWNHVHYARETGGLVVRYEDLLADPAAACAQVASHYRLRPRRNAPPLAPPALQASRMTDRSRRREAYFSEQPFTKTGYYQDGGYLAAYDSADMAFVLEELDADLMTLLGYGLPPPDGSPWRLITEHRI